MTSPTRDGPSVFFTLIFVHVFDLKENPLAWRHYSAPTDGYWRSIEPESFMVGPILEEVCNYSLLIAIITLKHALC